MATAAAAAKRKRSSKSVLKRIRQAAHRTAINRAGKSHLRTQVKRFRQALVAGNLAEARELLQPTLTLLDRSIRKGILHANTAARTKSRLMLRYNSLAKQGAAAPAR
jgi:small subunit ribosomal protein S20